MSWWNYLLIGLGAWLCNGGAAALPIAVYLEMLHRATANPKWRWDAKFWAVCALAQCALGGALITAGVYL